MLNHENFNTADQTDSEPSGFAKLAEMPSFEQHLAETADPKAEQGTFQTSEEIVANLKTNPGQQLETLKIPESILQHSAFNHALSDKLGRYLDAVNFAQLTESKFHEPVYELSFNRGGSPDANIWDHDGSISLRPDRDTLILTIDSHDQFEPDFRPGPSLQSRSNRKIIFENHDGDLVVTEKYGGVSGYPDHQSHPAIPSEKNGCSVSASLTTERYDADGQLNYRQVLDSPSQTFENGKVDSFLDSPNFRSQYDITQKYARKTEVTRTDDEHADVLIVQCDIFGNVTGRYSANESFHSEHPAYDFKYMVMQGGGRELEPVE